MGVSGKIAEHTLEKAGITTNKNMVPFDQKSPMITSGIRIGTPALTTRGFKENEMVIIANLINKIIQNINDEKTITDVQDNVLDLCLKFPIYEQKIKYEMS